MSQCEGTSRPAGRSAAGVTGGVRPGRELPSPQSPPGASGPRRSCSRPQPSRALPPGPPAPWWRGTVPSRWCGQVARIADVAAERGGDTRRSERSRRTRESQRKGLWSARPRRAKSPETRPSPGKVSPRHSRVGLPWRPSLWEHYPWGADTAPPPRDPPREPASPWVARAMRARATSHRGRTGRRGRRSRGARLRQTPAKTAMEMWPRPNAGAKEARGRGRASCREREDPHGGMASERCAPA